MIAGAGKCAILPLGGSVVTQWLQGTCGGLIGSHEAQWRRGITPPIVQVRIVPKDLSLASNPRMPLS